LGSINYIVRDLLSGRIRCLAAKLVEHAVERYGAIIVDQTDSVFDRQITPAAKTQSRATIGSRVSGPPLDGGESEGNPAAAGRK
jgi:hypothetical protein